MLRTRQWWALSQMLELDRNQTPIFASSFAQFQDQVEHFMWTFSSFGNLLRS